MALMMIELDFERYGRWYLLGAAAVAWVLFQLFRFAAGPAKFALSHLVSPEFRLAVKSRASAVAASPRLGWAAALAAVFFLWPVPQQPEPPKPEPPKPVPVEPVKPEPAPQPKPQESTKPHPFDLWARQSEVHRALLVDILKRLVTKRQENPDNDEVVGQWLKKELEAAHTAAQSPVDDVIAQAIAKGNDATLQLIDQLQSAKLEAVK